jgi:pimeloyl-ACP methyl ester carboxylesterase
MGRSLGGAVAVALAGDVGAKALVLEISFSTMSDVAAGLYPWLPVRWVMDNRYDSLTRIKNYTGPVIQCHGTDDRLVPIALAKCLFEGAPCGAKKWIEFPGLGHNDVWPDSYYDDLADFLDRTELSPGTTEANREDGKAWR